MMETGDNHRNITKCACPEENWEHNGEPQILAYDSLNYQPDHNIIPETEEFEECQETDKMHDQTEKLCPETKCANDEQKDSLSEMQSLVSNAKKIFTSMYNSLHSASHTSLECCSHHEDCAGQFDKTDSCSCNGNDVISTEQSESEGSTQSTDNSVKIQAHVDQNENLQGQACLSLKSDDNSCFPNVQKKRNSQNINLDFPATYLPSSDNLPCGQMSNTKSHASDNTSQSSQLSGEDNSCLAGRSANLEQTGPACNGNPVVVNDGSESLFENSESSSFIALPKPPNSFFVEVSSEPHNKINEIADKCNQEHHRQSLISEDKVDPMLSQDVAKQNGDVNDTSSRVVQNLMNKVVCDNGNTDELTQADAETFCDTVMEKNGSRENEAAPLSPKISVAVANHNINSQHGQSLTKCSNEQTDVMSSAGDQALLMVDLSSTFPSRKSLASQHSEISTDQEKQVSSQLADPKAVDSGNIHTANNEPDTLNMDPFSVSQGPKTKRPPSRPHITLGVAHSTNIGLSSLSLLRSHGQVKESTLTKDSEQEIGTDDVENSPKFIKTVPSRQNAKTKCDTEESTVDLVPKRGNEKSEKGEGNRQGVTAIETVIAGADEEIKKTEDMACWKEVTDAESGKKSYINNLSGHTVSEEQWSEMSSQAQREMLAIQAETNSSEVQSKPASSAQPLSASDRQALEDIVSKHFEQEDAEAMSKWRGGVRPVYNQEAGVDISTVITKWTNPVFQNYKQPTLIANMCPSGTAAKSCFNTLSAVEFSKDMLNKVKVLGQLDNKFIACIIERPADKSKVVRDCGRDSNLLVLFDQHAVHERIRLEHFTQDVYEVEDGERTDRIKRSEVNPSQPLTMDQDDLRIMKAFSKEFDRIGVSFTADKSSRSTVHVKSVPTCIAENSSDSKKNKVASVTENLENLIKEHIDLLKSTNGACGRLPLAVHKVLCSQACHGAVKFGDKLTIQECRDLLSSLASCNLPFQCAHGRPSVAPLVELSALEEELHIVQKRPNLWRISQHLNL